MHFFHSQVNHSSVTLKRKKIQMLKEFALLKQRQKHFKWLVQIIILKLPCEQIKHLTMKQCSVLSFVTRDFSPQAICSLMWQLAQAVACFWIPYQRSQSWTNSSLQKRMDFSESKELPSPKHLFLQRVKCLCDHTMQEGLRGLRGKRAPRHTLFLRFTLCSLY